MSKLYEEEYQAHQFWKGWHTLKEWADFGFNAVVFNDRRYWDGKMDGEFEITDAYNPELEMDYYDFDEDGYLIVFLKEVERE